MNRKRTKLGKVLQERGIKQRWIARKLGVSDESVSNWVRGRHRPQSKYIFALCKLLGMVKEDFIY